jgi:hypothetical protein
VVAGLLGWESAKQLVIKLHLCENSPRGEHTVSYLNFFHFDSKVSDVSHLTYFQVISYSNWYSQKKSFTCLIQYLEEVSSQQISAGI